jgi:hypothetical protein
LSVHRELGGQLSVRAEGSYNLRRFNRYAVDGLGASLEPLHEDGTWAVSLRSRIYFASVLQNITLEQQRTHSNSHGFSHTARSASWAAVVNPVPSLFLQLFIRFYGKEYDLPPLDSPDLQVGYVDEDSQDLLSARATWEWSPQWTLSLGASRVRSESTQPGVFYIKNLYSAQIRRNF